MPESLFDTEPRAEFSEDGVYRYVLRRRWGVGGRPVLFVALNPSTADADLDDPTVRRMVGFASLWGESAMELVNLYAFRATDPKALHEVDGPVGEYVHRPGHNVNDVHISQACQRASRVVVCWGATVGPIPWRAEYVTELITAEGHQPVCLGVTQDGHPRHPLYVPLLRTTPIPWEPPHA